MPELCTYTILKRGLFLGDFTELCFINYPYNQLESSCEFINALALKKRLFDYTMYKTGE